MIGPPDADGLYNCFKCMKSVPGCDFMYTGEADTEAELAKFASNGFAWACEGCFLRSHFCMVANNSQGSAKRIPSTEWPDVPYEDLTQCMHCERWLGAWWFTCYGR
jgi:hypothetical protein